MKAEAPPYVLQPAGPPGQLGEELHLDGAKQRLRRPETQAHLDDAIRG
jgi:hypothetical protein